MSPRISAILVTYNRANALHQSIPSLLNQTCDDFELLVADDASTDNTAEVCRSYAAADKRIRYIGRSANQGMPGNLNLALNEAAGPYIAVLHDDDIYSPVMLEKWRDVLDEHPQVGFVFNAYRALDEIGQERCIYREELPLCFPGTLLLESHFFKRWRFTSPVWGSAMIRKAALDGLGNFQECFGFWSDVEMWLRLSEKYHVGYVDEPLISVANPEVYPHLFDDRASRREKALERMFREARLEHYRGKPIKLAVEMMRHFAYAAASRTYESGCSAKRRVRRVLRQRS